MTAEIIVTQQGLEKLQVELKQLVEVKRPSVIKRIQTAKEYGDLSENSEYEDARNEQSFVEGRIRELEYKVKHAKVADINSAGGIDISSKVKCKAEGSETVEFELVGANESDPANGKISVESPIGRALMGASVGQTVDVSTPGGVVRYAILSVN